MQRFGTEHGPLFNATNKHDDPAHALSSFRVAWLRRAPCTFHPDSLNSRIGTLRSVFRPEYGRFPPRSYAPPAPTSRLFKGCSALGGEFSNCNYRCRKGGSKFFNSLLLKYVFAAPCPAFRRRYASRKPPVCGADGCVDRRRWEVPFLPASGGSREVFVWPECNIESAGSCGRGLGATL